MSNLTIPLHKPYWGREEEKAVIAAMRGGTGVGDLGYSKQLADKISKILGIKYALPTGSGTAALELACAAILDPGDEVILPSFTFSSCANAVMIAGAKPVFVDCDIETFNIDPNKIEEKINKETRAIMVVHYAGFACDMKKIGAIARKHNLAIIEDAAHALGAKYNGRHLGTIGDVGCFSFHGTKNVASGEGGMFVTNSKKINEIAEIIREKGTDRSSFMRGEKKKYSWVNVGRSLILSDILSAIAFEQIKKLDEITRMRRKNAMYLLKKLKNVSGDIILPKEPEGSYGNWHIFAIRVPKSIRDKTIAALRANGVEASFHFLPLHTSSMGKRLGYKQGDLPATEEVADTLIRLPIYPTLKRSEIDKIVSVLGKVI